MDNRNTKKIRPFVLEALSRQDVNPIGYVFSNEPVQYDPHSQIAVMSSDASYSPSNMSTSTTLWDGDADTRKDD